MPQDIRTFYEGLSQEDRHVLQNVAAKASTYNNVSEVLADLKNGSATLYDKAVSFVTNFRQTLSELKPNATKFVEDVSLLYKISVRYKNLF